nr:peptidase M23 [Thalassococcus arenae]
MALGIVVATGALADGRAAQQAAQALTEAAQKLEAADGARDRVKALTETVQAYEAGLAAMREGLRAAAVRETELSRRLEAREAEVAGLLAALSGLGAGASAGSLLHPQGPVGAARAGMLLSSVTPGLASQAQALRADLDEARALRQIQQDAADQLNAGLSGVQTARTALSQAVANRTDLPRKFTEDPVRTAILIASAETLGSFARDLDRIALDEVPVDLDVLDDRKGVLPMPVQGVVLREFDQADAAGVQRPGLVVATGARALVTTPVAATIRYRGPLLDYGLVSILEPQAGVLFVLAGLETAFGETGQVLPEGAPVGLMGGTVPDADSVLSPSGERGGADRTETLYIEVREGDVPVDPRAWFATDKG